MKQTLALYAATAANAGSFAAPYARALRRYLSPEVVLRIVGDAKKTDEFREVAQRLVPPFVSVRTLTADAAAELGMPAEPAAYVCAGTRCGPPVADPSGLRGAYDALAQRR